MDFSNNGIINNIKTPSLFLLIGSSMSGKSFALKWLILSLARQFNHGFVFSSTVFNGQYSYLPKDLQFDKGITVDFFDRLIEYQKTHPNKKCFLILDDLVGSQNFYDDIFQKLATTGRHFNITTFILAQGIKVISPLLRSNAHYVMLFKLSNIKAIHDAFEEYSSGYSNRKDYQRYFEENTKDYHFIFIDRRNDNKAVVLKAPKVPDFVLNY
jgi:hydroxymethylpyrimidine pyrophosphatase-like HAD family hydrolase